jgi:predicted ATP-dependent Lon-type protease
MGAVVAWFATQPEAFEHNGATVEAQFFCHEHQLLPGWEGPWVGPAAATRYELAGARLAELEARRRHELGIP